AAGAAVPAAGAFTLYLEAYGLARGADGLSRYRVEYEWQERETGLLERLWPGRRRSTVAYERVTAVPAAGAVSHAVAIRPDGLPPSAGTLRAVLGRPRGRCGEHGRGQRAGRPAPGRVPADRADSRLRGRQGGDGGAAARPALAVTETRTTAAGRRAPDLPHGL